MDSTFYESINDSFALCISELGHTTAVIQRLTTTAENNVNVNQLKTEVQWLQKLALNLIVIWDLKVLFQL